MTRSTGAIVMNSDDLHGRSRLSQRVSLSVCTSVCLFFLIRARGRATPVQSAFLPLRELGGRCPWARGALLGGLLVPPLRRCVCGVVRCGACLVCVWALSYKRLYRRLTSSRRPAIASRGYTDIQRHTLYIYTALYSIHAIHHPSGCTCGLWNRAPAGRRTQRDSSSISRPGENSLLQTS